MQASHALAGLARGHHHAGQAGVQRQVVHGPAGGRVSWPSPSSAPSAPSSRVPRRTSRRGWIEPAERGRVRRAPRRQLQGQPGQVDLGDLRVDLGDGGRRAPSATRGGGHAGPEAPGPPGALVGRGPGDRDGVQPGHAGPGVEPRGPGQPAVDHDPHALDGQAGLGDVGGQHDPAAPGRARLPGRRPARRRPACRTAAGRRRRRQPSAASSVGSRSATRRISAAPGRNDQHVARLVAAATRSTAPATAGSSRSSGAAGPSAASTGWVSASVATTGAGPPRRPAARRAAASATVADMASDAQVGPERRRDVEGQGQAEVGLEVPLVDLVEHHEADAGQLGSRWSRRVSTPSVTTSMRVAALVRRSSRVV